MKRDRLWYFANIRNYGNQSPVVGAFGNLNAGDATKWTYVKDPNLEGRGADSRAIYSLRLTSQVTERDRVSFSHEYQRRCSGSSLTPGADACRGKRIELGGGRDPRSALLNRFLATTISRTPSPRRRGRRR